MGQSDLNAQVPLDDATVRQYLRARSQPVCLFGEDAHDRRHRLRQYMTTESLNQSSKPPVLPTNQQANPVKSPKPRAEEFYIEGTESLRQLRSSLAKMSLARAAIRLASERRCNLRMHDEQEEKLALAVRSLQLMDAQVADRRPLAAVAMGYQDGGERTVVAGGYGGNITVRMGRTMAERQVITDHTERISAIYIPRFRPDCLLTASADATACLFRREKEGDGLYAMQQRFEGHVARIGDVKMHPFREDVVVTGAFDGTFGLFVNGKVVQRQTTGHSKVYRVNFHDDGSLLGTCGLEGGVRLWDLRSGRAIVSMEKTHEAGVLGLEFCGDGIVWATGGMDNMVRIWDLRRNLAVKTLAAHRALVSGLKFGGGNKASELLYSGSHDQTVKCWSARRGWGLLVACTSHNEKVTSLDCSVDGREVVSACYDKMWRLWTCESAT
eukprot:GFKZ01003200.1.p1 GENE.GFKZ01003200.1~~GFKZ01003200.1.p1  ORF type:complete len:440 (-),score=56.21 GFKZ01003200.1:240-1559(-)